jgi:hypothetical protein
LLGTRGIRRFSLETSTLEDCSTSQARSLCDRWHGDGIVIDPFRPGLRYFARTDREFELLTKQDLDSVVAAFRSCDVFIFTLGLTEAWRSTLDGAVYPACPGTIAGLFDGARHEFVNFTVADVVDDLNSFVGEVRGVNPDIRIILTGFPGSPGCHRDQQSCVGGDGLQ